MKKVKGQRPPPAGQTKEIVFLWGGRDCAELELGEGALLITEMKLGTCFKIEPGLEPEAFSKAWAGALQITDSEETDKERVTR